MKALESKNIYVIISGAKKISIMPELVKDFISEGATVYTMFTDMAQKMMGATDFNIPGNNIVLDYSKDGQELPLEDLVLVAPCTFNTLNKVAQGIADSYALTLIASAIGRKRKVLIAPAMNQSLWEHPQVKSSIERIWQWGGGVVWPEITPDKVTMAPLEKISDSAYNLFTRIRYDSQKLPLDSEYEQIVAENLTEFKRVGELLLEKDFINGSAGFLSKRVKNGILISASGSNIGSISFGDLSLVKKVQEDIVFWQGKSPPSSETPLITELYGRFSEMSALIHTHNKKLTYNPQMQKYTSREYVRYGRFQELGKVVNLLELNDGFAIMRLHGELSLDRTLYGALEKLERRLVDVR